MKLCAKSSAPETENSISCEGSPVISFSWSTVSGIVAAAIAEPVTEEPLVQEPVTEENIVMDVKDSSDLNNNVVNNVVIKKKSKMTMKMF